jgi:hypothetical protein
MLGFVRGVTGSELSPTGVLLYSGVWVIGEAGMSARPGEKWPWAVQLSWLAQQPV